jgi:transcriptional regulator with XRE-family HTH domain
MDFGKTLAALRKKEKLSQEELAFAVGISRQTLYTWETSIAYPNVSDLSRLSKALGVSAEILLNGCAIERFPKSIFPYSMRKTDDQIRNVLMEELDGWFIIPRPREETSWAIYDYPSGKRSFSYHLSVEGPVVIHSKKGYEITVEEYDPDGLLIENGKRRFYANVHGNKKRYLGMEVIENGVKQLSDFTDALFRKFWGGVDVTDRESVESYELTVFERKIPLFRLPFYTEKTF